MSSENSLMMVGRPSRFGRLATTQLARPSPASPMVLQVLMQSIMDLNQKVDALTLSSPRSVVVRDVQPVSEERRQELARVLAAGGPLSEQIIEDRG